MLFQWEVGEHTSEEVTTRFLGAQRLDPEVERFARSLFEGAVS